MNNDNLIYALIDPRTHEMRYVGQSTWGEDRPKRHSNPSRIIRERNHCRNWCKNLADNGLVPDYEVIEYAPEGLDDQDAVEWLNEAEPFWIAYFKMIGANLTNHDNGGKNHTGRKVSAETRAKLSAARKGKKLSPAALEAVRVAAKRRIGVKHIQRPRSLETKIKVAETMRIFMTGRKASVEHRQAISKGNKGKIRTQDVKDRISETKKSQNRILVRIIDGHKACSVCKSTLPLIMFSKKLAGYNSACRKCRSLQRKVLAI